MKRTPSAISSCANWCAARHEADLLQDFIHKEHLNAFMSMLSTTEVFGKGFNHA